MKTSLVLLSLLPIVALAAVIPQQDVKQVVEDVQVHVDVLLGIFGDEVMKRLGDIHEDKSVAEYKKELDDLQKQPQEKFEETKKQVKDKFEVNSIFIYTDASYTAKLIQLNRQEFDSSINQMDVAQYGDLKDKVSAAVKNAQNDFDKTLDSAKKPLDQAEKETKEQLDLAEKNYEAAILKNPGYDKYHEAVDLLKQGYDKAAQIMNGKVEESNKVMKAIDVKKINDDIEHTISGK